MKMTDADLADSLRQIEAAEFKLRGVLPKMEGAPTSRHQRELLAQKEGNGNG